MSSYRTESCILNQPDEIRDEWLDLQLRVHHSYFLSWGWIETWLSEIALEFKPIIVKVWSGEKLIGLGVFVARDVKRRAIFNAKTMYLHEYPFDGRNMVIEYNGLLAEKNKENSVYKETIAHLYTQYNWLDEIHFSAVSSNPDCYILEKCETSELKFLIEEKSLCWQVDLQSFEPGLDSYLASLSSNSRGQIRRSLRLYESQAPVVLKEAESVEEALEFFDSLKKLHVSYWQAKGERGSFANPVWEKFHRELIQKRFESGEIQMIKVANSISDIAFLFNYIWQQRVYVLQMGFNYPEDKRYKPGYVAHTLAIVHNRASGRAIYDFMHGDARYKSSLGTRSVNLNWVVMQRKRLKFSIENFSVGLVRLLRRGK